MRKVLLLVLVSMFLATACNRGEETAPAAPEASASAAGGEASPAAASPAAEASPSAAASPAAP